MGELGEERVLRASKGVERDCETGGMSTGHGPPGSEQQQQTRSGLEQVAQTQQTADRDLLETDCCC